jgi:putative nucleotidyltransferase with HDIG domain
VPAGWNAPQFNSHSLAVAVLSDLIAVETAVPYPEGAFTAGLLHDVGKLLMAIAMPEQFEIAHKRYLSGADSSDDCELDVFGATHAEISGAILMKWKLPKPIQEGVEYHHAPDEANRGELHLAHLVEGITLYHVITEGTMALAGQRSILEFYRMNDLFPAFRVRTLHRRQRAVIHLVPRR